MYMNRPLTARNFMIGFDGENVTPRNVVPTPIFRVVFMDPYGASIILLRIMEDGG